MTASEQRKAALKARRELPPEKRREYSGSICQKLIEAVKGRKINTVLSYMATGDEASPAAFDEFCRGAGIKVCYPLCGEGFTMQALIPGAVSIGRYGIPEPVEELSECVAPEDIDLVIVPCVGFDGSGGRIGHGAGYYDRYLPQCKNADFICIAFEAQRLEHIEQQEHDVSMSCIITEKT